MVYTEMRSTGKDASTTQSDVRNHIIVEADQDQEIIAQGMNGPHQIIPRKPRLYIPPMLRIDHRIIHTIVRRKVMNAIIFMIRAETGIIPRTSQFFSITRFTQLEDRPLTGIEMMKAFLDISFNSTTAVMEEWLSPIVAYQLTFQNGMIFCPFCPEFFRLYRSF